MFVKTTTRKRGDTTYTYLSLVESVRTGGQLRHNTLFRLGEVSELRDSGQLDRIIAALRHHVHGDALVRASELSLNEAPGFGAMAAVREYFSRLSLAEFFSEHSRSAHLADAVYVMVANRLLRPWSKRRTILEWLSRDVSLPDGVTAPELQHCYRALDALCELKDDLETHLYAKLTSLANLDLRLVCYDLTSTYFETDQRESERFPSRRFGYSRDKRSDLPQIVIGLLVTGDGVPIAHHVFAGNTRDSTTLSAVMADYQARFGVGRIALVADRGLITEDNLDEVAKHGFDHVLATRLHHSADTTAALEAATTSGARWVEVPEAHSRACDVTIGTRRYVVVDSDARRARDGARHEDLMARTEDQLVALAERVRAGRVTDPAKIGAASDRILRDSGVQRCFVTRISEGSFSWDYDQSAVRFEEELLAGRYVLTTSLSKKEAPTAQVVRHYRSLLSVERRFRVIKDFLALRPVYHYTEDRVRGHVALCVLAATIEAVMGMDLELAQLNDPELPDQILSPRRALGELDGIRKATIAVPGRSIVLVSKRNALQARTLKAFGVATSSWDRVDIT
jgi:transposase